MDAKLGIFRDTAKYSAEKSVADVLGIVVVAAASLVIAAALIVGATAVAARIVFQKIGSLRERVTKGRTLCALSGSSYGDVVDLACFELCAAVGEGYVIISHLQGEFIYICRIIPYSYSKRCFAISIG